MVDDYSEKVIVVQWKRFAAVEIDVFSDLQAFCDSWPQFPFQELKTILLDAHEAFENDDVKIESLPIIRKVDRPKLSKDLFWECDYYKIDWQRASLFVIERVIANGDADSWTEMIRFYGRDYVIDALKSKINYLTDYSVDDVCNYFSLKKEALKCYTKKQLNLGHWI